MHFSYNSIEEMVRYLATIRFEQSEDMGEYGGIWHAIYNKDPEQGNSLFMHFLEELYPSGCTVGINEVDKIAARAMAYLKTNIQARELKVQTEKYKYDYWVYFKPDYKVYPCRFGDHAQVVIDILADYFGDALDDLSDTKLKSMIRSSFELGSTNTTIDKILADTDYIRIAVSNKVRKGRIGIGISNG